MATKNIPEIDDFIRNYGAKVKETADETQRFIDEIRKLIMGATATSDFQAKSGEDIISDLNDMICKMTTLIMCSPKNKELLEKRKDELPHMTKIFPNPYLEDDKVYVITDEEMKKSMLDCMKVWEGGCMRMFENIKELWGAHVKFPQVSGEIEFNYSSMEIVRVYPTTIETRHYYFVSRNHSTRYFEEGMFNKEYEITNELTVFYSDCKEKCVEWLKNKRDVLLQSCKYNYERLQKSELKEVEERN